MTRNKLSIGLLVLMVSSVTVAHADAKNFKCPQPSEIQSTDFTSPSIWIAPPVAHSLADTVGVGLGGKQVKEFLGAEAAEVNHKKGWVCVYRSKGGQSVHEYQAKIKEIVATNKYLRKYLEKVNKAFADAEPYLSNYPQDEAIGFVGYQAAK
jgi:hypothetical protein